MIDIDCSILENKQVASSTFMLVLEYSKDISWRPGQFVMLRLTEGMDPFLRRPFSILGLHNERLEILYRARGKATRMLSRMNKGEELKVLGPLGNGFSEPQENDKVIYVAGGIGLPPVLALAAMTGRGYFVLGAKTRGEIPILERVKGISGIEVRLATEDGSMGEKGTVIPHLEKLISGIGAGCNVYACGPAPMLKIVSEMCIAKGARCEVSLEERMGCGFGVCHGCTVNTLDGARLVCKEGPCFDASKIVWRV